MKKKILPILSILFLSVCLISTLCACNKQGASATCGDISRRTDAYFAGESEHFAVSIEKGVREKCFIADGKATDVIPFCQITITPLKSAEYELINFAICGENKMCEGECKNADYGEYTLTIDLDFTPEKVSLTAGSVTSEIALHNVLLNALTSLDVINIAKDAFKDKLAAEQAEGGSREIYVKLITGDRITYYYYVSFIGSGTDYLAMLIEPKTGAIVSKK